MVVAVMVMQVVVEVLVGLAVVLLARSAPELLLPPGQLIQAAVAAVGTFGVAPLAPALLEAPVLSLSDISFSR